MISTVRNDLTTEIPEAVARQMDLRPGMSLNWDFDSEAGVLIVTAALDRRRLLREVREMGRRHQRSGESAVASLVKERETDAKKRDNSLE